MFGFVAVGQGGSSVVDLAAQKGYPSLAINFSQKDLDGCKHIDQEDKLSLIGSEGVGRDRNLAIQLMNSNWERVLSFVEGKFSQPSIEVIFVVFSTGGGSGSGIAPMIIDLLKAQMEKTVVAVPILPNLSEAVVNQLNTLDVFNELSSIDTCVLPIDNEKLNNNLTNKQQQYELINTAFVHQIDTLLNYTEQESSISNLDKRDLLTIFDTNGLATIGELDLSDSAEASINTQWINENVSNSWLNSIYIDPEMNKVVKSGVIIDGESSFLNNIQTNKLFDFFEQGEPINLFEGVYATGQTRVITICSGLSWCETRLKQIEQNINSQQERISGVLQEEKRYTTRLNLSSLQGKTEQQPVKRKSVRDTLKKYQR